MTHPLTWKMNYRRVLGPHTCHSQSRLVMKCLEDHRRRGWIAIKGVLQVMRSVCLSVSWGLLLNKFGLTTYVCWRYYYIRIFGLLINLIIRRYNERCELSPLICRQLGFGSSPVPHAHIPNSLIPYVYFWRIYSVPRVQLSGNIIHSAFLSLLWMSEDVPEIDLDGIIKRIPHVTTRVSTGCTLR